MINDAYAECLVARKPSGSSGIWKVLMIVGLVAAAASVVLLGLVGFILFLIMCIAAVRLRDRLNVEYEYLLVERQFSVDQICSKSRRKKAAEYALQEIQLMAPEHSDRFKDYDRQVKKITDYSSGRAEAVKYAFIIAQNGILEKVIIEPDEMMLRCFKTAAPGRVKES